MLDILPYECMDGLNEKGLFVSIMRVNIKEGDQPGRFGVAASMLVRYMLDDCANVEEAIAKVVSIWPFQNYETEYRFDVSGRQIQ